jgi:hypothetical protein
VLLLGANAQCSKRIANGPINLETFKITLIGCDHTHDLVNTNHNIAK